MDGCVVFECFIDFLNFAFAAGLYNIEILDEKFRIA